MASVHMCGKSVKRPVTKYHGQWGSSQAVSFSHLCDSVCSLKCIHLPKRALSSSLSEYNATRPTSEQYRDAAHTGYSRIVLASDFNDQAAMSVIEHVENYSKNLTLVTLHKSGGTPFNCALQSRNALILRQGLCELLLKGTIERVQASKPECSFFSHYFVVHKIDGGLCPIRSGRFYWNRSWCRFVQGTGCVRGLKDVYFHIQIAPHHMRFSEVFSRGHSIPVPCSPVGAGFGPAHFFEVHGHGTLLPLRASGMRVLIIWMNGLCSISDPAV